MSWKTFVHKKKFQKIWIYIFASNHSFKLFMRSIFTRPFGAELANQLEYSLGANKKKSREKSLLSSAVCCSFFPRLLHSSNFLFAIANVSMIAKLSGKNQSV